MSTKYYIGSSGDTHWQATKSKTLRGAKCCAMRAYQQSVGGSISVAESGRVVDGITEIVPVAVRYGYDNTWMEAV